MAALSRSDNPILWQESNYQVRTAPAYLRIGRLFGPLVLLLMIVGVAATLQQVVNGSTRELALYAIWIVNAAVAARAIVAGANAISREHVGQTWDALVLTGVSARQILLGKWRAVLRRVAPWMLALGVIRLVMLPILMLALTNRIAWRWSSFSGFSTNYNSYDQPGFFLTWVPWAAVAGVISAVVMSILEVLACTALGLALSALTRKGMLAAILAFSIRFAPVAVFAVFTRYELGPAPAYRLLRFPPFAIADSGTSPIAQFALPLMPWTTTAHVDALSGLSLAALVLIIILAISVPLAWFAIRRGGALPHPKSVTVGRGFRSVPEV